MGLDKKVEIELTELKNLCYKDGIISKDMLEEFDKKVRLYHFMGYDVLKFDIELCKMYRDFWESRRVK